jgi:hypothetical protein
MLLQPAVNFLFTLKPKLVKSLAAYGLDNQFSSMAGEGFFSSCFNYI